LHVSYDVSQARRPMNWTEANYQEQLQRLRHAREHADLVVDTDRLDIGQLVDRVVAFIRE
jgi:RNase adaptor protein for sRNA GlmZ degradation